ncbi:unnamed protein product [Moneuplotes crassus]|uniref:Uncharacterized protein n=1 Tax=Euplotes crassus TaxID=5936 RepID=A0AAD1ULL5_EUPCR|nr:unnamed protein product [Moneuplotes crassus]
MAQSKSTRLTFAELYSISDSANPEESLEDQKLQSEEDSLIDTLFENNLRYHNHHRTERRKAFRNDGSDECVPDDPQLFTSESLKDTVSLILGKEPAFKPKFCFTKNKDTPQKQRRAKKSKKILKDRQSLPHQNTSQGKSSLLPTFSPLYIPSPHNPLTTKTLLPQHN